MNQKTLLFKNKVASLSCYVLFVVLFLGAISAAIQAVRWAVRCLVLRPAYEELAGTNQTAREEVKASSWVRVKVNDLNKIQALFPDGDIKKMIDNYWVVRRPDGSVWYAFTGDWATVSTNILFGATENERGE